MASLSLTGVQWGALMDVAGMIFSPNPADFDGLVDCTETVGENELDRTDNTITVSINGNTNNKFFNGVNCR